MPRLRGGTPIRLAGYPLHMVHAEKIVTAVQRGTVNTRWRDFGDIWTLSDRHAISGSDLQGSIDQVAAHRKAEIAPLRDVLEGYAEYGQAKVVGMEAQEPVRASPESFGSVLDDVIAFAQPALAHEVAGLEWALETRRWS